MWTRKQVKEKGKAAFKKNYWKALVVALILSIIAGGSYSSFSGGQSATTYESLMNSDESDVTTGLDEDIMNGHMVMDVQEDPNGNVNVVFDVQDENGNSIESADPEDYTEVTLDKEESIALAVLVGIAVFVLVAIIIAIGILIDAFLINPIEMGCNRFFLKNLDEKAEVSNLAYGFDHGYKNIVGVMLRRDIAIVLWSMLFVIPGIIKSYEYRMLPYILSDNPEISSKDAFALSKEMMTGNKWKAFVLDLSFIGWQLLSICTLGLLSIFYVNPYKFSTDAALYEAIKSGDADSTDRAEVVSAYV